MIQVMIENFQKMRNFLITKIRNFDSFSFRNVSDSFVPRVMRDGVDTLGRARPVCTEALIFIYFRKWNTIGRGKKKGECNPENA